MNEFTKEELIDLNVVMSVWVVKYPDDKKTCELQKKLKSMIDNYCDPSLESYLKLIGDLPK